MYITDYFVKYNNNTLNFCATYSKLRLHIFQY